MSEFTRQQLCAALAISESTVRRLEAQGLPYTPVGARAKRYDLEEIKNWLRLGGSINPSLERVPTVDPARTTQEFVAEASKVKLRVKPSA